MPRFSAQPPETRVLDRQAKPGPPTSSADVADERLEVRIPAAEKRAAIAAAERAGVSLSDYVRSALRAYGR